MSFAKTKNTFCVTLCVGKHKTLLDTIERAKIAYYISSINGILQNMAGNIFGFYWLTTLGLPFIYFYIYNTVFETDI